MTSQIDWGFDDVPATTDDVIDFGDTGDITVEEISIVTEDFGGIQIVEEEEKVGENFTIVCKKKLKYLCAVMKCFITNSI